MSDNYKQTTSVGLQHVRVALRDTDGTIQIPSGQAVATAYAGLHISGANALTMEIPELKKAPAAGDDRTYYTFLLPPDEVVSGELKTSKQNTEVHALVTDTKVWGSDPIRKFGLATDVQGEEPAIFLWGRRRAVDTRPGSPNFGQKCWEMWIFPNALGSPRPGGAELGKVGEMMYQVVANDSSTDEHGETFTEATNGFTASPYVTIITHGKPMLDAWEGDNNQTTFNLSQSGGPLANTTPEVYVDGVRDFSPTVANGVITFGSPPADGAKIICLYEY
jgi:hypothetical protein